MQIQMQVFDLICYAEAFDLQSRETSTKASLVTPLAESKHLVFTNSMIERFYTHNIIAWLDGL